MPAQRFESFDAYRNAMATAVSQIVKRVPTLAKRCVFHGSAAASVTGMGHRESWDADFITSKLLGDTADIADEMKRQFGDALKWQQRDEEDHMFQGVLRLPDLPPLPFDLFRNGFDAIQIEAEPSRLMGGMPVASHKTYAAEKVGSVLERCETKDMYDLLACYRQPNLQPDIKRAIAREGQAGIKCLQRRAAAAADMLDSFAPTSPGYLPVTQAGTGVMFQTYLDERKRCFDLISAARREPRGFGD